MSEPYDISMEREGDCLKKLAEASRFLAEETIRSMPPDVVTLCGSYAGAFLTVKAARHARGDDTKENRLHGIPITLRFDKPDGVVAYTHLPGGDTLVSAAGAGVVKRCCWVDSHPDL